jgi:hypothetical protein
VGRCRQGVQRGRGGGEGGLVAERLRAEATLLVCCFFLGEVMSISNVKLCTSSRCLPQYRHGQRVNHACVVLLYQLNLVNLSAQLENQQDQHDYKMKAEQLELCGQWSDLMSSVSISVNSLFCHFRKRPKHDRWFGAVISQENICNAESIRTLQLLKRTECLITHITRS